MHGSQYGPLQGLKRTDGVLLFDMERSEPGLPTWKTRLPKEFLGLRMVLIR